jgi:16S rRNA U516 pseudouridylate synthase RsuA-like enzyme
MVRRLGNEVVELKRIRVASVHLGRLPEGAWRHLGPEEVEALLPVAGQPVSRSSGPASTGRRADGPTG